MTQLTDKERTAQMNDMRSFDEQMPCVGIFWYDRSDTQPGSGFALRRGVGYFPVLFPDDGQEPGLAVEARREVSKVVVKVGMGDCVEL